MLSEPLRKDCPAPYLTASSFRWRPGSSHLFPAPHCEERRILHVFTKFIQKWGA